MKVLGVFLYYAPGALAAYGLYALLAKCSNMNNYRLLCNACMAVGALLFFGGLTYMAFVMENRFDNLWADWTSFTLTFFGGSTMFISAGMVEEGKKENSVE